ncbi:MAG: 2-oxoglutarate dehydrogenase E1 subunit family protein, partial [Rhodoglobus sp.]
MSGHVTGIAPDNDSSGEFGANEWLVDEMYAKYLEDKNLVDQSWWPFLENYQPTVAPAANTT